MTRAVEDFLDAILANDNAKVKAMLDNDLVTPDCELRNETGLQIALKDAKNKEIANAIVDKLISVNYKNHPEKITRFLAGYNNVSRYSPIADSLGFSEFSKKVADTLRVNTIRVEDQKRWFNAIDNNDIKTVKEMIAEGDLGINNKIGNATGLDTALKEYEHPYINRSELVKLLLDNGADPTVGHMHNSIIRAVVADREDEAILILEKNKEIFKGAPDKLLDALELKDKPKLIVSAGSWDNIANTYKVNLAKMDKLRGLLTETRKQAELEEKQNYIKSLDLGGKTEQPETENKLGLNAEQLSKASGVGAELRKKSLPNNFTVPKTNSITVNRSSARAFVNGADGNNGKGNRR